MYLTLIIEASKKQTEIWLGDDEGHFVQKEVGVMNTSLLPGDYIVQFDLNDDSLAYPVKLDKDLQLIESVIIKGPSCVPPIPEI